MTGLYTHTQHTQPFYGSVEFVRDNPGEPVPEETWAIHMYFLFLVTSYKMYLIYSASTLTLLVGQQEGHPACKKMSGGMLAWLCLG